MIISKSRSILLAIYHQLVKPTCVDDSVKLFTKSVSTEKWLRKYTRLKMFIELKMIFGLRLERPFFSQTAPYLHKVQKLQTDEICQFRVSAGEAVLHCGEAAIRELQRSNVHECGVQKWQDFSRSSARRCE